jgi:hypothetical protein
MFEADGELLAKLTLEQLKALADKKDILYLVKVKKDVLIAALVGAEDGLMTDTERSVSGSGSGSLLESGREVDRPDGAAQLTVGISGSESVGEEEERRQDVPVGIYGIFDGTSI